MRARDLGIHVGHHQPGRFNAITDVDGVRVGHVTLIEDGRGGSAAGLAPGDGPVRTGVTVVIPHEEIWAEPVFAGAHRLNGSGDVTGLEWLREAGELTSPIGLTNTHSVGTVRDALVRAQVHRRGDGPYWCLPVVGETYDGLLNDINGHHVREAHVEEALRCATTGPVAEGNVGGGTGMICHDFKAGVGTSSRVVHEGDRSYTVGVLVQANYGRRERLRINGTPIGELIGPEVIPVPERRSGSERGSGSIIVVIATDAPLLPNQCARLAQRAGLAVGRMGGTGEQYSGDIFLAFSTGNRGLAPYAWDDRPGLPRPEISVRMIAPQLQTLFFDLTIEATEEAIVNSLVAAETMTGRAGVTAHALNHQLLKEALSATA